jgi:hypothetical protein
MPHLPTRARVPLPEPLSGAHLCVRHDGRRGVAVGEQSGRLWLLEIDPEGRTCSAHGTPITVPRRPDGDEWMVGELSGSRALDRLLLWSDRLRVYALPSGEVVADLEPVPGRAVCLSPGGRWAVSLEASTGWTMELDAPVREWRRTAAFHAMEREGGVEGEFLDHVDTVVAHPLEGTTMPDDGEERFWIAAGCYGFVLTHQVHAGWADVVRVPGETRGFSANVVYDPTELVHPSGQRHVFVLHGFRCGLAAIDPATGEQHDCWPRGGPGKQPYGFFYRAVPCGEAPIAWVSTRDGDFLWRVGDALLPMPEAPGVPLALYPDALLSLAPGGGELLWCDLPVAR